MDFPQPLAHRIRESIGLLIFVSLIPLYMIIAIQTAHRWSVYLSEKPEGPPRWVIMDRRDVFRDTEGRDINGLKRGEKAVPNPILMRRPENTPRIPLGDTGRILKRLAKTSIMPWPFNEIYEEDKEPITAIFPVVDYESLSKDIEAVKEKEKKDTPKGTKTPLGTSGHILKQLAKKAIVPWPFHTEENDPMEIPKANDLPSIDFVSSSMPSSGHGSTASEGRGGTTAEWKDDRKTTKVSGDGGSTDSEDGDERKTSEMVMEEKSRSTDDYDGEERDDGETTSEKTSNTMKDDLGRSTTPDNEAETEKDTDDDKDQQGTTDRLDKLQDEGTSSSPAITTDDIVDFSTKTGEKVVKEATTIDDEEGEEMTNRVSEPTTDNRDGSTNGEKAGVENGISSLATSLDENRDEGSTMQTVENGQTHTPQLDTTDAAGANTDETKSGDKEAHITSDGGTEPATSAEQVDYTPSLVLTTNEASQTEVPSTEALDVTSSIQETSGVPDDSTTEISGDGSTLIVTGETLADEGLTTDAASTDQEDISTTEEARDGTDTTWDSRDSAKTTEAEKEDRGEKTTIDSGSEVASSSKASDESSYKMDEWSSDADSTTSSMPNSTVDAAEATTTTALVLWTSGTTQPKRKIATLTVDKPKLSAPLHLYTGPSAAELGIVPAVWSTCTSVRIIVSEGCRVTIRLTNSTELSYVFANENVYARPIEGLINAYGVCA